MAVNEKTVWHPILVHFPIAFYFLEAALLVLWKLKKEDRYLDSALFVFRFGYFFMLLAMAAGYRDAGGYKHITGLVRTHFTAAVCVFIFATCRAFFWRFGKRTGRFYAPAQIASAIFLNILITVTGHFGAELVYK